MPQIERPLCPYCGSNDIKSAGQSWRCQSQTCGKYFVKNRRKPIKIIVIPPNIKCPDCKSKNICSQGRTWGCKKCGRSFVKVKRGRPPLSIVPPPNIKCPDCGKHNIRSKGDKWQCNDCKRLWMKYYRPQRRIIRPNISCPRCGSHHIYDHRSRWYCADCGKKWQKHYDTPKQYISVRHHRITIVGTKLREKLFLYDRIRVVIDTKNKLLGVLPSKKGEGGYLVTTTYRFCCAEVLRDYRIKYGRYPAKWSEKHQMIIAEIEFNG